MGEIATQLGPWVAIVALVIGIINTISQWVSRPGRELKLRVDELGRELKLRVDELGANTDAAIEVVEGVIHERFKEHDRRIQRLEDGLPHMPTKEDLHVLTVALAKLDTRMDGLQQTVGRMDRHLREGGA